MNVISEYFEFILVKKYPNKTLTSTCVIWRDFKIKIKQHPSLQLHWHGQNFDFNPDPEDL